jgi:hypothetical protein
MQLSDHQLHQLQSMAVPAHVRVLTNFFQYHVVETFLMVLVFVYAAFAFATIIFDEEIEKAGRQSTLYTSLTIIDMTILVIFVFEIIGKSIAFGDAYTKDIWNIFDGLVVVASLVFGLLLTLSSEQSELKKALGIRGILRLMRIIIVLRKIAENPHATRVIISRSNFNSVTSPAERVLMTLRKMRADQRLRRKVRLECAYAIHAISSGTLYTIATEGLTEGADGGEEAAVAAMAGAQEAKRKRLTMVGGQAEEHRSPSKENVFTSNFQPKLSEVESYVMEMAFVNQPLKSWADTSAAVNFMMSTQFGDWDFDVLRLNSLVKGQALSVVFTHALKSNNLWDTFIEDPKIYENFVLKMQASYVKEAAYHNATHAADVVQSVFWFLYGGNAAKICNLTRTESFAMLFAAMIHDVEHPGVNNPFHIKTRHKLALLYNDKSVLENHHSAFAYDLLSQDKYNCFGFLPRSIFDQIREMVISMVRNTDMVFHFPKLAVIKGRISDPSFPDPAKKEDKTLMMDAMLHTCDISNAAKPTHIAVPWAVRVISEFWKQGELEKQWNLPPNSTGFFLVRETTNIAKCQIGFIEMMVAPLFSALENIIPNLNVCVNNLQMNKDFWGTKVEWFNEKLENKNEDLELMQIPKIFLRQQKGTAGRKSTGNVTLEESASTGA